MAKYQTMDDSEKLLYNIEHAVKSQLKSGLDKAAKKLAEKLEENSPDDKNTGKNKYKKSWKINRRYKYMRVISNSKMVCNKDGEEIPLSNILEINQPHMRSTFDNMADELCDIILDEIQF